MPRRTGFEELSEVEAAIVLLTATVVADGEVHTSETDELVHQLRIVVGDLGFSEATIEDKLEDFLSVVRKPSEENAFKLNRDQIKELANLVVGEDLKVTVMNAVFEISYADDDYHESERKIVRILREIWGV